MCRSHVFKGLWWYYVVAQLRPQDRVVPVGEALHPGPSIRMANGHETWDLVLPYYFVAETVGQFALKITRNTRDPGSAFRDWKLLPNGPAKDYMKYLDKCSPKDRKKHPLHREHLGKLITGLLMMPVNVVEFDYGRYYMTQPTEGARHALVVTGDRYCVTEYDIQQAQPGEEIPTETVDRLLTNWDTGAIFDEEGIQLDRLTEKREGKRKVEEVPYGIGLGPGVRIEDIDLTPVSNPWEVTHRRREK